MSGRLLVIGLGYSGAAAARAALGAGWQVAATKRDPSRAPAIPGIDVLPFAEAGAAIREATHLFVTAAPGEHGDPTLAAHGASVHAARQLRWIGYISTTAVYGDRGGAEVDETAEPTPMQDRARRRLAAEFAWATQAQGQGGGRAVELMRAGGIYGPGRSVLDELREGTARRTIKPGHRFSRIHRDDIAHAALAAMRQERAPGVRVLHLVDDEPAESAAVVEEGARLLGIEPPPAKPFEAALAGMSPMARSFWSENRAVRSERTRAALGLGWLFPSYREGLRGILRAERGESD